MNKIKQIALKYWADFILKKWNQDCEVPQKIFEQNLKFIQKHSKQSNVLKIKNINELRQLPLTNYSNYQSTFKESLNIGFNPLNGEKIKFWATSTGSSGTPKLFPISKSVKKTSKPFQKIRASLLIKKFNIWTGQPELIFVLPGEVDVLHPKRKIGQIGYYFQSQTPKWLKKQFIFSKALYKNVNDFNHWHIVIALLSDCSGITTSIPSRLTHFLNQINFNRLEIRQIILNKEYPKKYIISTSQKRINYILKILEKPLVSIKDIWPSLTFVCLWKSGKVCNTQMNELTSSYDFKNVKLIDQIYNSSEDIFNIPLINEIGGPLNIYNHLIEFYDSTKNIYLWPWEIKPNRTYDIVITNSMGLTRYQVYDKIICTGFYKNTPKIAFHSRSLPEISLGWCVITEKEIQQALDDSDIIDFSTFYFTLNKKGNGLTIISFNKKLALIIEKINKSLETQNKNYKKQINLGNVLPISFQIVNQSSYNAFFLKHPNNKRIFIFQ